MSLQRGDVVLVGDALYDAGLAAELLPWLRDLATHGVDVYLGDPGRWVLTEMDPEERGRLMTSVATYTMPPILADEHHGITSVTVHKLLPF
jgi:predicted nicotinamide N-methyase